MIALSDIRQKLSYDCGHAAVACVIDLFGRRCPKLIERLGTTPIDGTDPRQIEAYFRQEGFCVQSGDFTVEDLKYHTGSSRPVIVLVKLHGGHYLVVAGVRRGFVYFQDPDTGPARMRIADFEEAWSSVDRMGAIYDKFGIAVREPT